MHFSKNTLLRVSIFETIFSNTSNDSQIAENRHRRFNHFVHQNLPIYVYNGYTCNNAIIMTGSVSNTLNINRNVFVSRV